MPASSSTTAVIAVRCCAPSRGTAAYSVPTAMCRARLSRKHAPAVADRLAVVEQRSSCSERSASDWAGNWRSFSVLWGLPATAMLIAAFVEPPARTVIWTVMLLLMGGACLANARLCNRIHCFFTGPFLLLMAAGVVAHANGVSLGRHGWTIIGSTTLIGAIVLWCVSEWAWGRYAT